MATPTRPQPSAVTEELAPAPRRLIPRSLTPRRLVAVAALVGVLATLVIAFYLAVWFRGEAIQLQGSAAASNDALFDAAATDQVSQQVREAVQLAYSYDFARLDENERAATNVITGPFEQYYRQQFLAKVREQAPSQQAVVVATVPALAVKVLDGDRAILVAFVDQQANQSGQAKPLLANGRLTVTAQRVDGSWKIADAEPF
jgi:Mce-associated membrane protein